MILHYNITAAGAVDREFLYIESLPELSQGLPELEPPRADPDLHSLPVPPELSLDVFLTFSYPSQIKPLVLREFLAGNLPKKLSKLGVLAETSMNKSKNITR